jgi:molybdopterin synthase sulfur carrier subunit
LLEIAFSDGFSFNYPCEYLRVSTDQSAAVHAKKQVDFQGIEPCDTKALQINFDDGYSCTCSWDTLHDLGVSYEERWQAYLQQLQDNGLQRGGKSDGKVSIKVLYFIQLAVVSGRDDEDLDIPASVTNVASLLAWLRKRGDDWNEAFTEERVQVTVNKHFAETFTLIEGGDEVAIVPRP